MFYYSFADNGYNTTDIYGDDKLCDLSTTFSRYAASYCSPSTTWLKLVILVSPYDYEYQVNILIPAVEIRLFFKGFFGVC